MKLQTEILPLKQRCLFEKLTEAEWISPFYLVGGTGLALQIGHQQSVDFDFVSPTAFDQVQLSNRLGAWGKVTRLQEAKGTLHCSLDDVKLFLLPTSHMGNR